MERRVPLVGFADQTYDARSACVAAIDCPNIPRQELERTLSGYRDLGAPIIFVPQEKQFQWWIFNTCGLECRETISWNQLSGFFDQYKDRFSPQSVYRAKTIGRLDAQQQLDFVDIGLMPLLEQEMGKKLGALVVRIIKLLYEERGQPRMTDELGRWLFQTAFWLLGAKILKDKDVPGFVALDLQNVSEVFQSVKRHYNAEHEPGDSTVRDRHAVESAAAIVSAFASLSNLTMESLAYVYENTGVTKKTRKAMGTHATPPYLVDYIVWQLAPWIEGIDAERRVVLEPTCGHAPFLTSGARLLRELIGEMDVRKRHQYLRKRLFGIEKDGFAREVARLSLTLADVPNPNGWQLELADVYSGDVLSRAAKKATILLCNPPFQNFTPEEQAFYKRGRTGLHCFNKSAELLWRTLPHMPKDSVFGVIVPQGFLHAPRLAELRKLILEQFELAEICALPENVFALARHKCALLLGRKLKRRATRSVIREATRFRRVQKWDLDAFKDHYEAVTEKVPQSRFYVPEAYDFRLQMLGQVWEYCQGLPQLRSIAIVGKGLEYKGKDDLPPNRPTTSEHDFPGAVLGFATFQEGIRLTKLPRAVYMSLDAAVIRRPGLGSDRGKAQILLNYARVSLGPWRLKGLIDPEGHPVTSSYIVIRPKNTKWPLAAIWGLLNSPFANAYGYCNSMERLNLIGTLRGLPIPRCEGGSLQNLVGLVNRYFDIVGSEETPLWSPQESEEARQLMPAIDAEVLRLYDMPPRIERQLLDLFQGWKRPGVDFDFWEYFPPDFESWIPLHEYLSEEYQRSTVGFVSKWVEQVRSPEIIRALKAAEEAFIED